MAYLGQDDENIYGPDSSSITPEETQALESAFSKFTAGDIVGAAATLGPTALVAEGLVSTGVGAVIGAAIAVALALTKLIGRGRAEADIIVPVQNQLINPQGTGQLDQITHMLVQNPNVTGLQSLYDTVGRIGTAFIDFVSNPRFTDGRASVQALNTIMPYINGTCGYSWPPPMHPNQANCIRWGDGTPGGVGTDGMMGAIARAILRLGGQVPPPLPTQTAGPYQQLQYQGSQTFPYIPQAGTLPANAPLSPLRPQVIPVVGAGLNELVPALLLGGAALYWLRK